MTNLDPQAPDNNKAATLNLSWEKAFTVICLEINDIFCHFKMPPTIYAEEFCLKVEMRNWAIWSAKSYKYKILCIAWDFEMLFIVAAPFFNSVDEEDMDTECVWSWQQKSSCQWAEQDPNQMTYCFQCWIRHQEPVSGKPNLVLLSCDAHVHAGWGEEDFVWGQMVGSREMFMKKGCLGHIYRLHRCCWGNQVQFDFQIIRSYSRIL